MKQQPFHDALNWPEPMLSGARQQTAQIHRWLAFIALMPGTGVSGLTMALIAIALPALQHAFQTNLISASGTLSAYALTFAVMFITARRLASIVGYKQLSLAGWLLFALGSMGAVMAPTITWLIGCSVIQAVGGAALTRSSLATLQESILPVKAGIALLIWGGINGLIVGVDLLLGRWLLQWVGWRVIFFFPLPLSLISLAMIFLVSPFPVERLRWREFDVVGLLTLGAALFCLTLGISQGPVWGWFSPLILSLSGWFIVLAALFCFIERGQMHPLMTLALFRTPNVSLPSLVLVFLGLATPGGTLFLVLYFLQLGSESLMQMALALFPLPLALLLSSLTVTYLGSRLDQRLKGLIGLCLLALGLGLFSLETPTSSYLDIAWHCAIIGAGLGICMMAFPQLVLADSHSMKFDERSGIFIACWHLGVALGVAILISVFSWHLQGDLEGARQDSIALVQADTALPQSTRTLMMQRLEHLQILEGVLPSVDFQDLAQDQSSHLEIASVNARVAAEVRSAASQAFAAAWIAASLAAASAMVLTCLLILVSRQARAEATVTAAWSTWYFFGPSGRITPRTVTPCFVRERQRPEPLVPLQILRGRTPSNGVHLLG
jgi:MFS family permease